MLRKCYIFLLCALLVHRQVNAFRRGTVQETNDNQGAHYGAETNNLVHHQHTKQITDSAYGGHRNEFAKPNLLINEQSESDSLNNIADGGVVQRGYGLSSSSSASSSVSSYGGADKVDINLETRNGVAVDNAAASGDGIEQAGGAGYERSGNAGTYSSVTPNGYAFGNTGDYGKVRQSGYASGSGRGYGSNTQADYGSTTSYNNRGNSGYRTSSSAGYGTNRGYGNAPTKQTFDAGYIASSTSTGNSGSARDGYDIDVRAGAGGGYGVGYSGENGVSIGTRSGFTHTSPNGASAGSSSSAHSHSGYPDAGPAASYPPSYPYAYPYSSEYAQPQHYPLIPPPYAPPPQPPYQFPGHNPAYHAAVSAALQHQYRPMPPHNHDYHGHHIHDHSLNTVNDYKEPGHHTAAFNTLNGANKGCDYSSGRCGGHNGAYQRHGY